VQLLEYLLAEELVPDETVGRGLIMRGDVLVDDQPVTQVGAIVRVGQRVRIRGELSNSVSRGYSKLQPAAARVNFDCHRRISLDLGVSTGGFTQVLLEQGASRVYAVDIAYGITALSIRNDSRVVLLERTNARKLNKQLIPEQIERVVGDLSFISWRAVLPAVMNVLAGAAELLLLIKPQFELAARGQSDKTEKGVVQDSQAIRECLTSLYNTWETHGLNVLELFPAAVRGAKGNQEYFAYLRVEEPVLEMGAYLNMIEAIIAETAL